MKSSTQQAVDWLLEPTSDRRTIVDAAKKFGLNSAEGIGLAVKKARIKKLADELDRTVFMGVSNVTWESLYKLLK